MTATRDGHDISGATAARPTNCEIGHTFFDTTTNELLVWNGTAWQTSADSSDQTVDSITGNDSSLDIAGKAGAAGAAGGSVPIVGGAGGAGSSTTAGGAGGAASLSGGAGGAKSGTGAAAGGAGAAASVVGGAGGATASSGSDAGGAGGGVALTGGVGGAASAGTGNGGAGGSITLTPGAGGATTGGTAGVRGAISLAGPVKSPITGVQSIADSGTITLPTTGKNAIVATSSAANKTGVILAAGIHDGQEITLINTSSNSLTFAAAGTSRVADGTGAILAALTAMTLVWEAGSARWYRV